MFLYGMNTITIFLEEKKQRTNVKKSQTLKEVHKGKKKKSICLNFALQRKIPEQNQESLNKSKGQFSKKKKFSL